MGLLLQRLLLSLPRRRQILVSTVRYKSSGKSNLHQELQQGLKNPPSQQTATVNPSSPSSSSSSSSSSNNNTLRQAIINGVCSFMVVLLAGQSWKAGHEKRRAQEALLQILETNQGHEQRIEALCSDASVQSINEMIQRTPRKERVRVLQKTLNERLRPVQTQEQERLQALVQDDTTTTNTRRVFSM